MDTLDIKIHTVLLFGSTHITKDGTLSSLCQYLVSSTCAVCEGVYAWLCIWLLWILPLLKSKWARVVHTVGWPTIRSLPALQSQKSQSRNMEGMERATGKVIHIHSELNNRIGVGKSVCLSILTRLCLVTQSRPTLSNPMDYSLPGFSVHGFLQEEYWSGLPCTPPGDLPNPRSNSGLLHCRQILYCLSHQGSPQILEWVAYPFSRASSQPRNQTGVSCNAGRLFFTSWATRKALECDQMMLSEPFKPRIDYWVHSYYFMKHQ